MATSKHDCYTGSGEAAGQWTGRGAAGLGLAGDVDPDDMAALYGRFVVPATAGGKRLPGGRIMHEVVLGQKPAARPRPDGTIAEPLAAPNSTSRPEPTASSATTRPTPWLR